MPVILGHRVLTTAGVSGVRKDPAVIAESVALAGTLDVAARRAVGTARCTSHTPTQPLHSQPHKYIGCIRIQLEMLYGLEKLPSTTDRRQTNHLTILVDHDPNR